MTLAESRNSGIPQKYLDMVGTECELGGGLFTRNRVEPDAKYQVLDIRWGTGRIIDFAEMKATGKSSYEHPTFQLLVKNDSMKRSRWTNSFPIRDINLANEYEQ